MVIFAGFLEQFVHPRKPRQPIKKILHDFQAFQLRTEFLPISQTGPYPADAHVTS